MRAAPSFLLLAALLAQGLPSAAAPAPAEDLLLDIAVPGSASFGGRVETGALGTYQVEVASSGLHQGSVDSFGIWLYDGDKAFQFGIAIGGGISKDRLITRLGAGGLDAAAPSEVRGEVLDGGSIRFTIGAPPFSTRHFVAWGAGLEEARLRVWGPPDTRVAVNQGAAWALGDRELPEGPSVQAQHSYAQFQFVGAKAMLRTAATLRMEQGMYGLFASHEFKMVCPQGFGTSSCQRVSFGVAECRPVLGHACDKTLLSWEGPAGSGAMARAYTFTGHAPPGDYTFTVDAKLDAYGPWRTVGPAWTGLGEDTTTLAIADVAIP